jgi:hypothetical protein
VTIFIFGGPTEGAALKLDVLILIVAFPLHEEIMTLLNSGSYSSRSVLLSEDIRG